jgi:hypothetical protein
MEGVCIGLTARACLRSTAAQVSGQGLPEASTSRRSARLASPGNPEPLLGGFICPWNQICPRLDSGTHQPDKNAIVTQILTLAGIVGLTAQAAPQRKGGNCGA